MGRYDIEANSGPEIAERRRHVLNLVTARYRGTKIRTKIIKAMYFNSRFFCWASAAAFERRNLRFIVFFLSN